MKNNIRIFLIILSAVTSFVFLLFDFIYLYSAFLSIPLIYIVINIFNGNIKPRSVHILNYKMDNINEAEIDFKNELSGGFFVWVTLNFGVNIYAFLLSFLTLFAAIYNSRIDNYYTIIGIVFGFIIYLADIIMSYVKYRKNN